jgi:hypothetical protein
MPSFGGRRLMTLQRAFCREHKIRGGKAVAALRLCSMRHWSRSSDGGMPTINPTRAAWYWDEIVELQRLVAPLRDECAAQGRPARPNIKPSGMERGTEPQPPGNSGDTRAREAARGQSLRSMRSGPSSSLPRRRVPASRATRASWCRSGDPCAGGEFPPANAGGLRTVRR